MSDTVAKRKPREVAKRKPRKRVDEKLTYGEEAAARRLGVSYSTLLRRRMKGLVPFYRVGSRVLYDDECLAEFLEKSRQAAA